MLHLLYALALLLLFCGACAILAERFTLSPALLPLPVLSGAVVVLYLCGVAGFLRVGAVAVLLALAAVWVVGLVQYRPAGVAAAWKRAASVPGFTLFLGGAAFIWVLFCVQQPMFTQWDEFTAWGLAPKMVVERGAFYVADPVNLKASFTYPATSLLAFLFQPFGLWAERACLAAIDTLALACLAAAAAIGGTSFANMGPEALFGCLFAFLAAFGWGFEGCVAGFGTVLIDYRIGIAIRQLTAGLLELVIAFPVLAAFGGDIASVPTILAGAITDPAIVIFAISGLFAMPAFSFWYKGNSMCGTALGMACNGMYAFWGPFFIWIVLGVLNIGGMSADYPPLSIIQWVGALVMVVGIFLIAVNPADHLAKRKEQNNEE